MAFDLHVTLAGLCMIVQEKDPATGNLVRVHALLVDARQEGPAGTGLHEHEAFIAFDLSDYDSHSGYTIYGSPDAHGHNIGKCILAENNLAVREDLIIETGMTAPWTVPITATGKVPASTAEEESLTWIPEIQKLKHSTLSFKDLHPDCIPLLHGLVAKVTFRGGRIRSTSLSIEKDQPTKVFIPWEFKTSAPGAVIYSGALADSVTITLPVQQDFANIVSSHPNHMIALRPPQSSSSASLTIGNFPTKPHLAPLTKINHFQWYYELLANVPVIADRPIPFLPPSSHASGSGMFCPLAGGG